MSESKPPAPHRLTASEALRRIRAGTLRAEDLLESCLERIAARDPAVHAFTHVDAAAARAALARAPSGPLQGLPVAVKDVLDVAGMPAGYGSPIWDGHRPHADAAAVAWARAAGAVVLGKTVTTEFAMMRPGATVNPLDPKRTPGGSSSGSAAAVADFMTPVAFATQTAGSIIRPAAFCGVVGYKPSFGMIPRLGLKVMSDSLDTIGVIARSVADCALFAGALTGRDLGDPDTRPDRPPRIGLCRSPSWPKAAAETVALFDRAAATLARAGAYVTPRELPDAFRALEQAHPLVMHGESARSMGWEMLEQRDLLSGRLRERLEWGAAQGPAKLDEARATFGRLQAAFPATMEGVDVLLTPSAPGEAPVGLDATGDPVFNYIWTSLHVPCVTVPAGTGPGGAPLGVQIIARRGEDRAALIWAQWVAAALVG
ncbi:Amidase [Rhodovastum atsumiense]|uniref:Amidase n=1 Tax=Rhodovastum atsumiense TaxID=504468 RepID=A0A5M6ISV1_9PROT|nr:amidase [Rhodovastum atsumiense]KAA5611393.1 amidase [Rhodovastum atsumiense]CAH2603597.1 Amidase [Rhodovastum atsumiense]